MSTKKMKTVFAFLLVTVLLFGSNAYAATSIFVNLPSLTLTLTNDGKVVKKYPIAAGMPTSSTKTITGKYNLIQKQIDPTYTSVETGETMAAGEGNPLGPRWMRVTGNYGIHGNAAPYSIGSFASHGCMRMFNWDVKEVFNNVNIGTPVTITYDTIDIHNEYRNNVNRGGIVVYPDVYGNGTNNFSKIMAIAAKNKIYVSKEKQNALSKNINSKKVVVAANWSILSNGDYVTSDTITVGKAVYANVNTVCNYYGIKYKNLKDSRLQLMCNDSPKVNVIWKDNSFYAPLWSLVPALGFKSKYDNKLQILKLDGAYAKNKGTFVTSDVEYRYYKLYVNPCAFVKNVGLSSKLKGVKDKYYLNGKLLEGYWNNHNFYASESSLADAIYRKSDYWSLEKFIDFI